MIANSKLYLITERIHDIREFFKSLKLSLPLSLRQLDTRNGLYLETGHYPVRHLGLQAYNNRKAFLDRLYVRDDAYSQCQAAKLLINHVKTAL